MIENRFRPMVVVFLKSQKQDFGGMSCSRGIDHGDHFMIHRGCMAHSDNENGQ
nr:hypothetical protein [uncultured bacterium]